MAATKTKTRSKSSSDKNPHAFSTHPFEPGQKVNVYNLIEADQWLRENREPTADPVKTVTVTKDGDLKVTGLDPASYVAAAKTRDEHPRPGISGGYWSSVQFTIKTPAQVKAQRVTV